MSFFYHKGIRSGLSVNPFHLFRRCILHVVTCLTLILLPCFVAAQGETQNIDSNWQYRWGDSPFTANGIPEWTVGESDSAQWKNVDFPSNPPGRKGKTNVWYRTVLSDNGEWRDPVIYIYSVDLITEVYIDGQQIYHYGSFDQNGQGRFEGWPWHMIALPNDFAGKVIYFRIFSSSTDIGLWGQVKLMERIDLLRYVIDNSLTDIVVSGLSLLISLLALIFAFVQSNRQSFLLISFFTFASSVMLFAQSQAKQLLINAPLLWDYLAATAYFVLPIAMAMLFDSWHRWKFTKVIKAVWIFHLVFVILAIGGSLTGIAELSTMYLLFDILLTVSLLILFVNTFMQFKQVSGVVKILISTFAIFSIFLLIDMGVAHSFIPWTRMPIAVGLLLFSITMVAVSLKHFAVVQKELKELNATLEQKVDDRTAELKRIASTDSLTSLMNRRAFYLEAKRVFSKTKRYQRCISILMLDIDNFKQFNDQYGHAIGDAVLIKVASCIRKMCRETDLPARFGGEEFVVLLEETDATQATLIAERLRNIVSEITLPQIESRITISIGVSVFDAGIESLDALITRADSAMYIAKNNGRNNCHIA
ncbi:GGDEF domain-containing protein [Neptunomonas antarctica]|uniref:diguanylate cyclase n=1 Tax=Neptunomonas antarctica TaxID=619304 RepID=A0A1N7MXD5_9GAMM|nr:GGDEF domain-containing protein [Neptunomonas antarctica]SIS90742.1 diguanylate cyclase (GGDEF) domain-containing protein [Neptunomonas antarctica]